MGSSVLTTRARPLARAAPLARLHGRLDSTHSEELRRNAVLSGVTDLGRQTKRGARVLLADADPVLRGLAAQMIEGEFEVFEAGTGAEALALFPNVRPDLVVLDVKLPDMTGVELCSRLRATPKGDDVPILLMIGIGESEALDQAYAVGASDFIIKPGNVALLAHRLRYLSRTSDAIRQARRSATGLSRAQRLARLAQWELDVAHQRFRWAEEAQAIYGFSIEETSVEGAFLRWVHPADREMVAHALASAQPHTLEYRVVLADGRVRFIHHEADVVIDPTDGRMTLEGAAQDVTALRDAERQVHDLAYYDSLTHLPNRAFVRSFLDLSLADLPEDGRSTAVLALDLDAFSKVNDTFGRTGGDEVLCEVARRIASCVRSSDAVVSPDLQCDDAGDQRGLAARLGSDEFLVVLHDIRSPEDAALVAQRIGNELSRSYVVAGRELFISSRIGIASFPADATDVETLLDRAGIAMDYARNGNRNGYRFYTPSMQEASRARLELETSLRSALRRSRIIEGPGMTRFADGPSEFHLAYQPKVEVPSGRVVGVEALLRWTSPDRGMISPADFIPVAEDTGLIVPLGAWVLKTACAQAKQWSMANQAHPLRVAVNVSARQFHEPGFVALVADALAQTQLAPELLELELTEGMVMEDTTASKRMLEELKGLGVRIALDDFGTGYSSLGYLTRLPIDALKIDRSFIRDLGGEGRGEAITTAIVALAQSLKIDVVVEGVENAEQLAFVSSLGSAEVQGFFFARPMPAADLGRWCNLHETKLPLARRAA